MAMTNAEKQRVHRARKRARGLRKLEAWLPEHLICEVNQMISERVKQDALQRKQATS